MDAPPVRYVRTSDGYSIAYTAGGEGQTIVLLPVAFSHVQLNWRHDLFMRGRAGLLRALSDRFRLVAFDFRNQGLSARHATEKLSFDHFILDLDAVIDTTGPDAVVLVGAAASGHVAIRYAATHPERVKALVLLTCSISMQSLPSGLYEVLPSQNWEFFLRSQLTAGLRPEQMESGMKMLQQTTSQSGWLQTWPVLARSNVGDALPGLTVPSLVIHPRGALLSPAEESSKLAAAIPNGHLVMIEGEGPFGEAGQTAAAIDEFVATCIEKGPLALALDRLSSREAEVLRLLAAGRSNQQIADELVISRHTVRRHVSNIFDKTGAANRAQATAFAKDHGLA